MNCTATTKQNKQCRRQAATNGFCTQHGCGFYSNAKDFIKRRFNALREGPASAPSSKLQTFMNDETSNIVQLRVGRKPILGPLRKALDAISFGRFSRKAKELNYENVYHNYILVTFSDGRTVKIEKNETVQESKLTPDDLKNETFNVPLGDKQITVKELINNASKGNEIAFYRYRGGSNNCQEFTKDIVVRNGLIDPEGPQNAAALIDTLPGKSFIPNLVTDAAAVGHRLLAGDGLQRKIKLRRKQKILCPL